MLKQLLTTTWLAAPNVEILARRGISISLLLMLLLVSLIEVVRIGKRLVGRSAFFRRLNYLDVLVTFQCKHNQQRIDLLFISGNVMKRQTLVERSYPRRILIQLHELALTFTATAAKICFPHLLVIQVLGCSVSNSSFGNLV